MAAILKGIKQSVARRAMLTLRAESPECLARFAVARSDGRIEHRFWQRGGGYDRNIVELDTVLAVIGYIHNNPVRRSLVTCPTDWLWSSARWYERMRPFILEMDPLPANL